MSLPLGNWRIDANGYAGELKITSVDTAGSLAGTLHFAGEDIDSIDGVAFWDDHAKKITFMRVVDPAKPATFQIFTGYLFPRDHAKPAGPFELAGSFMAFQGTGAVANRVLYGWFASHVG